MRNKSTLARVFEQPHNWPKTWQEGRTSPKLSWVLVQPTFNHCNHSFPEILYIVYMLMHRGFESWPLLKYIMRFLECSKVCLRVDARSIGFSKLLYILYIYRGSGERLECWIVNGGHFEGRRSFIFRSTAVIWWCFRYNCKIDFVRVRFDLSCRWRCRFCYSEVWMRCESFFRIVIEFCGDYVSCVSLFKKFSSENKLLYLLTLLLISSF